MIVMMLMDHIDNDDYNDRNHSNNRRDLSDCQQINWMHEEELKESKTLEVLTVFLSPVKTRFVS